MNNFLNRLFYFLIITNCYNLSAQIEDLKEISAFTYSIKSVDQFIDRFNYDKRDAFRRSYEAAIDIEEGSARQKAILTLFDFQKIEENENNYSEQIEAFIGKVENNESSIYLDFYDKQWYVKLLMDITYEDDPYQLEAVMYNYSIEENKSSWTFASVHCKELNWYFTDTKPNILLPPNSDGTDFMNVRNLLKENSEHLESRKNNTNLEPFFKMISDGSLDLSYIKDIDYVFLQIPEYILVVKEFRRNDENSGWLIDELIRADENQKIYYKATQLGMKP